MVAPRLWLWASSIPPPIDERWNIEQVLGISGKSSGSRPDWRWLDPGRVAAAVGHLPHPFDDSGGVDPVLIGNGLTLSSGIFFVFQNVSFCRPHQADEKYRTFIGIDEKYGTFVKKLPLAKDRQKITQSQRKKPFSIGFGLSSIGFWPTEVSVIHVVYLIDNLIN
jgi:hypothetical protein